MSILLRLVHTVVTRPLWFGCGRYALFISPTDINSVSEECSKCFVFSPCSGRSAVFGRHWLRRQSGANGGGQLAYEVQGKEPNHNDVYLENCLLVFSKLEYPIPSSPK